MKHLNETVDHGRTQVEMALNPSFSRDVEARGSMSH